MKTRKRGNGMPATPPGRGSCPTHKVQFATRREARKVAKSYNDPGLNAYRCDCGWFHIGHTPQRVRAGEVPKRDWLAATRSRSAS